MTDKWWPFSFLFFLINASRCTCTKISLCKIDGCFFKSFEVTDISKGKDSYPCKIIIVLYTGQRAPIDFFSPFSKNKGEGVRGAFRITFPIDLVLPVRTELIWKPFNLFFFFSMFGKRKCCNNRPDKKKRLLTHAL